MSKNISRLATQYKNRIADAVGDGGQIDLGDGKKATWSWCSDPRYPSPRYKFVSITGNGVHESAIFDTQTGNFVS